MILVSQNLTDASTINWTVSDIANLTLTGNNHTINIPSGLTNGTTFQIHITSQANQVVWASGYTFPGNKVPFCNPMSGSIDTFTFLATSSSAAVLVNYSSNPNNWSNFDGTQVTPWTMLITGVTNGLAFSAAIPNTSNVLFVYTSGTTSVNAVIYSYDALGRLVNSGSTLTVTTTGVINVQPRCCVLTDGNNAIISYVATRSTVQCQNLLPVSISGLTLVAGTETQVRAAETAPSSAPVIELDTSNFGLSMRTATANILYVYQCSLSGATITIGSSPATIETGNSNTLDVSFRSLNATNAIMYFLSTVTATNKNSYVTQLTFSGTGSTPSFSTPFNVVNNVNANQSGELKIRALTGVSNHYVIYANQVTGTLYLQVLVNNSGTFSAVGTAFTANTGLFNQRQIDMFIPDANHVIYYSTGTNLNINNLVMLNVDASFNLTLNSSFDVGTPNNITACTFTHINNNSMGILMYQRSDNNAYVTHTVRL